MERSEGLRDPDDTVVVHEGQKSWRVSRYCPHAGEDISTGAIINNGVLRCLGHNFNFDLATGLCINARCDPMVTRRLEPVESPH